MKPRELLGFKLTPCGNPDKRGDFSRVRITRTATAENLFEVLADEDDGTSLFREITEMGGLAVYKAKKGEEPHSGRAANTNFQQFANHRPENATTRYSTIENVLASIRRNISEANKYASSLTNVTPEGYALKFQTAQNDIIKSDAGSNESELYLEALWRVDQNDIDRTHSREYFRYLASVERGTPYYEHQWSDGHTVISNQQMLMHRRHDRAKIKLREIILDELWHTDAPKAVDMHILHWPYRYRLGMPRKHIISKTIVL